MNDINAQELAQALFEEAGDALIIVEPETETVVDVNPMVQRLTGFRRSQLLAMRVSQLVRPEAAGGLQRLRLAFRKTGVFHSQEGFLLRHATPGVWLPVNLSITRLHVKPQTLALITARDVREQRQAHEQLKAMEAELRRVIAAVSDCLWSAELHAEGRWEYRYLSPVVTRITGQPPEHFLKDPKNWRACVHPDDRPVYDQLLRQLRPGDNRQEEYRILRADGTVRWVRDSITASLGGRHNGASDSLHLDGVLTDITDRRQALEALRRSEERMARIVETNIDGILLAGPDGRIQLANAAAERIFGMPRSELTQRTCPELFRPATTPTPGVVVSPWAEVMRTGRSVSGLEYALRRPDRSWVLTSVNAAPWHDERGHLIGVVISISDITARKRSELSLKRHADQQQALAQLSRLLLTVESEADIYRQVPTMLRRAWGFPVVAVELCNRVGQEWELVGQAGLDADDSPHRLPIDHRVLTRVVLTGQPAVWTESLHEKGILEPGSPPGELAALICCPLTVQTRVLGVLLLASRQPKVIPPWLPNALQTGADLIAQTIERKRAEESLRRSEKLFRDLFEGSPDAVFVEDFEGNVLDVNPAGCRLHGVSRLALIGANARDLVPAFWHDRLWTDFRSLVQGETSRAEGFSQHIDGHVVPVEINASHIEYQGRKALLLHVRDLTERRRAEEALRSSEERLGRIVEAVGDGILIFDRSGLVTFANAAAERITGRPRAEIVGHNFRDWLSGLADSDGRPMTDADSLFLRTISTGQAHYNVERIFRRPDGTPVIVTVSAVPLRDSAGEIIGVVASFSDITRQKQAEESLRQSEERFRALVENSSDAIVVSAPDGTIRYVSPPITRLTGWLPDELLGRNGWDFIHPDDLVWAHDEWAKCLATPGQFISKEFRWRAKDGRFLFMEGSCTNRLHDPNVQAIVCNIRDVSERKKAEQAIRESEQRFQAFMDHGPAVAFIKDEAGRLTYMNRAFRELVGAQGDEWLGKTDFDIWPAEVAHQLRAHDEAILANDAPAEVLEVMPSPSGPRRWMSFKFPFRDAAGRRFLGGMALDVTERLQAEEALRASERRYRLLFERNLAGVFRAALNGRILDCNEAFARTFGFESREELLTSDWSECPWCIGGDVLAQLRERQSLANVETCLRRRDGGLVWVLENINLLTGDDGQPVLEGTVIDITERKRAEEERIEQHALLRALIDSIPDLIFYKNRQGYYLGCNAAFERYVGRNERELIDRSDLDLFPSAVGQAMREKDRLVLESGRPNQCEEWLEYPDGRRVLVETLRTPFFRSDGRILGLIGISRDITGRKRLEEHLRHSQKMEAVGRLAGGVAHDFNNLLTAILGNLALVLPTLPPHDPNRRCLQATEQAAVRAAELTRQLLGFSRQTLLRLQPMFLQEVIHETVAILSRTFDPRIIVETEVAPDIWPVQADAGQMSQVLLNLCLNARDAMPEGGRLRLEVRNVTIDEKYVQQHLDARPGDFVRLRVSDTGHGIPPEIRSRIFDPFFTTKEPGKGTGLGLAVVFGIVQQHGGWVTFRSEVGQGTEFDVFLPRCRDFAADGETVSEPPASRGSETILFVDDEATIRHLGQTVLEQHGYRVISAEDGRQAVDIYREKAARVDLVVLDLTMPRMSGKEALHALRAIDPNVPVLLASGYSPDDLAGLMEKDDAVAFIGKPYRPQELLRSVRAVLDKARARR
ncbi:MAG: PAS domain S-box protein [Gemmataceae bacterium]|nr:PAS domain S-box protein [Gemmataceae bacterium]MDW8264170.1 PAS domain S-box protein [Gemmataceae bacterium]